MGNQIRGMQQANRNVQQGMNLLQTAEGAINEISNILGRMRELAVQAASDTVTDDDRQSLDLEFNQLETGEITRIAKSTEYNGMKLLDGTFGSKKVQVSADHSSTADITNLEVTLGNFSIEIGNTDFAGRGVIVGDSSQAVSLGPE